MPNCKNKQNFNRATTSKHAVYNYTFSARNLIQDVCFKGYYIEDVCFKGYYIPCSRSIFKGKDTFNLHTKRNGKADRVKKTWHNSRTVSARN